MGLFDLFSTKPAEEAAAARKAGLQRGFDDASRYLTDATGRAQGYYGQAAGLYDPYVKTGGEANTMYANALGLNGAPGTTAAQGAFQAGPGYQFQVDQGLEAAKRASGGVYSGNLLDELLKRGQGYANQEYGGWLNRLQGLGGQGLQATGAKAGVIQGQGGLEAGLGQNLANYGYQTQTGIGNANADASMSKYAAAGNLLGAITGGLALAGKAMGAPIPGNSIGGMFGLGGGGMSPYGGGGYYDQGPTLAMLGR